MNFNSGYTINDMRSPTKEEFYEIARKYGISLSQEDLEDYLEFSKPIIESYKLINEEVERVNIKYERNLGYRPSNEENRFNAWAWKCSIRVKEGGILSGKRFAIKDNISVAGIPMHSGTSMLEGYVPIIDATVAERILENGGEIVGKSSCEALSASGGSHTSYPLPVRNPYNESYMAGGSSSGSAVLVASGEVDVALGTDQAGSVRIPSSWCGVFGLKPTWGLIPYTGIMTLEPTLDHVGIMARNVRDIAITLEAISGRDGKDPRQYIANVPERLPKYSEVKERTEGFKIAIVKEGFSWKESEEEVNDIVLKTAGKLRELGIKVREISIPMHYLGIHILNIIRIEGVWATLIREEGLIRWLGNYDVHFLENWSKAVRSRINDLPPTVLIRVLLGEFIFKNYGPKLYAKAQNLRKVLKESYDRVLEEFDFLLMPTTPTRPQPLPKELNISSALASAKGASLNTCPFNLTGHPAINVPVGFSKGLPVGMMLVSEHFNEEKLISISYVIEKYIKTNT